MFEKNNNENSILPTYTINDFLTPIPQRNIQIPQKKSSIEGYIEFLKSPQSLTNFLIKNFTPLK